MTETYSDPPAPEPAPNPQEETPDEQTGEPAPPDEGGEDETADS